MVRRWSFFGVLLAILLALTAPTVVSVSVCAYSEGVHFENLVRYEGTGMTVTATKSVHGRWRET